MNRPTDPLELIRRSNPVPDPDRLPGPDSSAGQELLGSIVGADRIPVESRRRRLRGRAVLLAAVLFVLTGAAGAVAVGVFSPDPADVEAVLGEFSESAGVHLPGWRPELSTEGVWCMYGLSEGVSTYASEYPLDQVLTVDLLVEECATGNDMATGLTTVPTDFTLCAGTFSEPSYRQRLAGSGETILAGNLNHPRPGFPVVLSWQTACETIRLETSWEVNLRPLIGLDELNLARQVEIALRAEAAQRCIPRHEADTMAIEATDRLGDSWLLVDLPLDVEGDCYEVRIDAEWGIIAVWNDDTPPITE